MSSGLLGSALHAAQSFTSNASSGRVAAAVAQPRCRGRACPRSSAGRCSRSVVSEYPKFDGTMPCVESLVLLGALEGPVRVRAPPTRCRAARSAAAAAEGIARRRALRRAELHASLSSLGADPLLPRSLLVLTSGRPTRRRRALNCWNPWRRRTERLELRGVAVRERLLLADAAASRSSRAKAGGAKAVVDVVSAAPSRCTPRRCVGDAIDALVAVRACAALSHTSAMHSKRGMAVVSATAEQRRAG